LISIGIHHLSFSWAVSDHSSHSRWVGPEFDIVSANSCYRVA
jgi:hypothetical protein